MLLLNQITRSQSQSFLCRGQYMKILTLKHRTRLDIDPYLSGWEKKKKAHVTSLWADTWSDTLINICHPSSLLRGSGWWGCLLWVYGDWIDTAAKWSVLAVGADFISQVHFFFSFLQSRPGWSHRASRLYLYFYFSPFTGYESSSYYCKLKHNQYSEYVQDVSLICEIA